MRHPVTFGWLDPGKVVRQMYRPGKYLLAASLMPLMGCLDSSGREAVTAVSSCMSCHNGAQALDYSGPGLENPHPFPGAENLWCVTCHGGNPQGADKGSSHIPPPPEIGDREYQDNNATAYFNRLTLTGIDKFPDYQVAGVVYTSLDYLQFINPGDLRVVTKSKGCGQCHGKHAEKVAGSLLATETGIFSGSASYAIGVDNHVVANQNLYQDTAADLSFRAVDDLTYSPNPASVGQVGKLIEFPVYSVRGDKTGIFQNPLYDNNNLDGDLEADGQVTTNSDLANLYHEQIAFTCGDCHLGSAGANNRYGDYRSSGCTACHMPYSLDGRSRSQDPNVNKLEPADPDDIDDPEHSHIRSHRIVSSKKILSNGTQVQGIDDYTCAGCHQGSNRTVMQYWGIRLDQNQDLRNDVQYPANPVNYKNTSGDTRLFDPVVGNNEFNGRNRNQYILFEDYDGDNRDDTPADVHYEAGMGCIDCHGSWDLHGGDTEDPNGRVMSRQEHGVAIRCQDCHGTISAYATSKVGKAWDGATRNVGTDSKGNVLPHIVLEADNHFYLYSKVTGKKHFLPQTKDTVHNNGKTNPFTGQPIYNVKASYAMGRFDNDPTTGLGPQQTGDAGPTGFTHSDNMSCAACHSSWQNTCMGCHLEGEYNNGNNFSNITGQRIVFRERNADFVYQSPVPFQLGVGSDNKIRTTSSNTKAFFTWFDRNGNQSKTFTFSDRQGKGSSGTFPSLGHNAMMAHSIRGKVTPTNEGPRYCVACHLTSTVNQAPYNTQYSSFKTAMATNDFAALDFNLLKQVIGQNPGNQLNHPIWVHMVAGLGSGLFLFDKDGCPQNPLDNDANRKGCDNGAPAANFNVTKVYYNLDRIVLDSGVPTSSSNHPMLVPGGLPNLRDNSGNTNMAGPLGQTLIRRLTDPATGIVLDSWIDANGVNGGDAFKYVK